MNLTTTDSLVTGFPLVIATQTQQPTARLQLRNSHGQIIQQWLIKSNKCTLGSAASCGLRCELPGVAPYHALLVIGARQIFVRALAPKLTRDGQPFNELLLTNEDGHFEIAGYRFELNRNDTEVEPVVRAEASSPQRIKFTLARPFELRNRPQTSANPQASSVQQAADLLSNNHPGGDPKWVAQLIQAAMQPLECQLHNLAAPLSELQRESRKQRRLRKRRALRRRNAANSQPAETSENANQESSNQLAEQLLLIEQARQAEQAHWIEQVRLTEQARLADQAHLAEQLQLAEQARVAEQAHLAQQVEAIVGNQSAAMETLTERVADVSQQLQTIERIVAEQRQAQLVDSESQAAPDSPQLTLQSAAIEQLQQSVVSVSSTLARLQEEQFAVREDDQQWKNDLQSQLGGLAQIIENLSANVADVHLVALRAASVPDANTLPAPDSLPPSLSTTPEAWGLAADEPTAAPLAGNAETAFYGSIQSAMDQYDRADYEQPDYEQSDYEQPENSAPADAQAIEESLDHLPQPANFQFGDSELAHPNSQRDLAQDDAWMLDAPQQNEQCEQLDVHEQIERCEQQEQPQVEQLEQIEQLESDLESDIATNQQSPISNHQSPPMWTVLEPSAATNQQSPISNHQSLPSWWADDEPASVADDCVEPASVAIDSVEPASVAIDSELQPQGLPESYPEPSYTAPRDIHIDERAGERSSPIDERVYESTSECDERISESLYEAKDRRVETAEAADVGKPSEEFFGLAQLALEDHLREADPLPFAPLPLDSQPLDSQPFNSQPFNSQPFNSQPFNSQPFNSQPFNSLPLDHAENAAADELAGELEGEQMTGYGQADAAQSEAALDAPRGGGESAGEIEENDSVEEYMRKLLARMRGAPEEEVELPVQAAREAAAPSPRTQQSTATSGSHGGTDTQPAGESSRKSTADQPTANYAADTLHDGVEVTEPFDPEKYLPRALAPERSNSLAAMRELANSSARTAIHKSTRQRHVSSIALKSVIAGVGLVVGMVLLAINGFNLNISLVATVAAFLVAIIWGYDSITSIRPMLQHELILTPQSSPATTPTDEQD